MRNSPLGYPGAETRRVETRLNLVNVGTAQILTIPGEALPNIGYYLKRKMRGEHNLLFGLTNDAFGYLLTKVDWGSFKSYDYVSRTSLGEMTGEIYIRGSPRASRRLPSAVIRLRLHGDGAECRRERRDAGPLRPAEPHRGAFFAL